MGVGRDQSDGRTDRFRLAVSRALKGRAVDPTLHSEVHDVIQGLVVHMVVLGLPLPAAQTEMSRSGSSTEIQPPSSASSVRAKWQLSCILLLWTTYWRLLW